MKFWKALLKCDPDRMIKVYVFILIIIAFIGLCGFSPVRSPVRSPVYSPVTSDPDITGTVLLWGDGTKITWADGTNTVSQGE